MVTVISTEGVLDPRRETGSLVVEENATEFNSRFAIGIYTFLNL